MRSCEVSKLRGGLSKNLRSEVAKVLKLRSCEVAGRVVKKSEAKLAKLRSCDVAKLQNWINVPTAPLYCDIGIFLTLDSLICGHKIRVSIIWRSSIPSRKGATSILPLFTMV